MSEYQYYEFQAIDRPLTKKQQAELRKISTRADISSAGFVNEYNYGDLRADPLDLVKKYFDAHIYVTNWGTHIFMLKIPVDVIDVDLVAKYQNEDSLDYYIDKDNIILEFSPPPDEEVDDWEEGDQWLDELIYLREDLMRGDLRSLYIAWLAGFYYLEDSVIEPPLPPGMTQLTEPLEDLVEFLRVHPDAIGAAIFNLPKEGDENSGNSVISEPSRDDVAAWVETLPLAQRNNTLVQLISGEEPATVLHGQLHRQFRKAWSEAHPLVLGEGKRTVGQLHEAEKKASEVRIERERVQEAKEKAIREKKEARERKAYLKQLVKKEDATWAQVETLLQKSSTRKYEQAVKLLIDLRDLAVMQDTVSTWEEYIDRYRRVYSSRHSLMKLFNTAEFPD